jgi:hypothetical protein
LNGRKPTEAAEEFLSEVKLLTSVCHRNLVRLLGCCTQGHGRLLVHEFMSNNSLYKHLVGGRGYTAPEYVVHGLLTEKDDVYSYVIVVLEIVSWRKCVDERLPAPMQLLLQLVCFCFKNWLLNNS